MKDVKNFVECWQGRGDEKSDTQKFWLNLLRDVLGVERPDELIEPEKRVELEHVSFIDIYIPSTRVLIEQKSLDVNLDKAAKQSDGTTATPFEQAKRYYDWLPVSQRGRWLIVCNFGEFRIHDMEQPKAAPEIIKLTDLPCEWRKLQILVDPTGAAPKEIRETALSVQAGELVGRLYNALKTRYRDPSSAASLRSLNILCVRIVFLLYAEDAGLFEKSAFHDYLTAHRDSARHALIALFSVLDKKPEERDPYETELNAFPYVNGGLFEEKDIEIPNIDGEPLDIILNDMSASFDWSGISPTIFGAVFESTLNPETRRGGGMHYTSIENIHRVINPLFLDGLRLTLKSILDLPVGSGRTQRLRNFQKRIAGLTFLDPACGSGNFLTETYLSLRRLENVIIGELAHGQISFAFSKDESPIQVSIGQFYGIEINDFAVAVARTALWIAEAQMMKETMAIVQVHEDILPLKSYNHIIEGNALRIDWHEVLEKPDYIMGNPPFIGYSHQSREQKEDILSVYTDENGKPYPTAGKIDYVAGWYFKAAEMMGDTKIRAAFVSTNSITQGEQVTAVWHPLYNRLGIHIDFAWRTFVWDSEASDKAHVHVVIIGFSWGAATLGALFEVDENGVVQATNTNNINPYLMDAPTVFIEPRQKPLCEVPEMVYGNKPTDGGFLFLTEEERAQFLKEDPENARFIRQIYGAAEYINNKKRYCLWLVGASPAELRKSSLIRDRVEKVRAFRLNSPKEATKRSADTPALFQEVRQPDSEYILIPCHSSETRQYIPVGFVTPDIIVNNAVQIIPNTSLYHFGVLTSSVHMAWMRTTAGRLKSDYRYSKDIVYNNFPWPTPTDEQRAKIEQTAQAILDARALYPDSSLADLYDELTMPPELRKAHRANDAAVCSAYGFEKDITEPEIVARLMRMCLDLIHTGKILVYKR